MKSLNVDIEDEQHRRLKLRAVTDGISIREFVKQAIESELNRRNQKGENQNENLKQ